MIHQLKEKGMSWWIKEYVLKRAIPIPKLLYAFDIVLCRELRDKRPKTLLFFLKVALSRQLSRRDKLPAYNTVDDAVNLLRNSKRIIILTGAGISVSCGIPDFRSENGLYAMLKQRGEYDLDDPQQIQIYPSNFTPSPCHHFIKFIEDRGQLLRNYTQNIDTLETLAGVKNVLQCHGSFASASCIECRTRVPGKDIEDDILRQRIPLCKVCQANAAQARAAVAAAKKQEQSKKKRRKSGNPWDGDHSEDEDEKGIPKVGVMKPDITFFGEKLDDRFDRCLEMDREKVDLLIVIGTSLKVAPVADMILHIPHSVPQILINKTPVKHINPDIVLLGNADDVVVHLCERLGWELPRAKTRPEATREGLRKRPSVETGKPPPQPPRRVGNSHVWLFEGAEGGNWLETLEIDSREPSVFGDSPLSQADEDEEQVDSHNDRGAKRARVI
ncbi:SIR2-domain-containing protein [Punctularia strigosozonata HHB-11173 SS5]|uniref:SIR2-domain-containing protein n=1 Tax=Punctularia strigosozonata (strain HHB-11173) TaxID=741275 RepID=UPI000441724F|nr:SIR2-domain-containing protein [Punctularia strigosozonata HHB-11173 SS5]EIN09435.1 SIR2-domain-containing protein [Punctularia strigosozonata HHB-11173 SS5]